MKNFVIANKYAKTVYLLAEQKSKLPVLENDFSLIAKIIDSEAAVLEFFKSPKITVQQKIEVVEKTFQGKVDEFTLDFLKFLLSKKRIVLLKEIIEAFIELKKEKEKIIDGIVYSYEAMDATQIEAIAEKFKKKNGYTYKLINEVDETIGGGFVVKIKDTLYDMSVKNQLKLLKEKLLA